MGARMGTLRRVQKLWNKWKDDPGAKDFIKNNFQYAMKENFVFASNRLEGVGTQDINGTREVIQKSIRSPNRIERETKQTMDALVYINELWEDILLADQPINAQSVLLTLPNIQDSHRILMKGLLPNAGEMRTSEAFTNRPMGVHFYRPPTKIPAELQGLIDQTNIALSSCHSLTRLVEICTHWLLEFLEIHPFSDGNGRTARLWLSFMLLSSFPFIIYIPYGLRDDYIASLQKESKPNLRKVLEQSILQCVESLDRAMER